MAFFFISKKAYHVTASAAYLSDSCNNAAADTHAIIWYVDSPSDLSQNAAAALDNAANDDAQRIFISVISLIEMQYLTEKGRIKPSILPRILAEIDDPKPIIEVIPIDRIVADSIASIPRELSR